MAKKQKTPAQIAAEYEKRIKQAQSQISNQIDQLYNDLINAIVPYAASQTLPEGTFSLSGLPALNNRIDQLISALTQKITVVVENGINGMWMLGNDKANTIADIRLDGSLIPEGVKVTFYDPNIDALTAFKKETVNGLNLSDRVYNATAQYEGELEAGLGLGISKGQSAAEMGRDLRQYLKNPDKLFRRVRDEEGNLQLSENAKAFHPGTGVYRSSVKNIERLTVTTTNNAYRKSDTGKYKNMPFVLGYEWKLSAQHVKCDLCDSMAGEYPVDFVFTGGHPFCICYIVPKLMNDAQFKEYQSHVLAGTDTPENIAKIAPRVKDIPESATTWLTNNAEIISNLKSTPYFWANNAKYMPEVPTE
jgi:hypothetical protein